MTNFSPASSTKSPESSPTMAMSELSRGPMSPSMADFFMPGGGLEPRACTLSSHLIDTTNPLSLSCGVAWISSWTLAICSSMLGGGDESAGSAMEVADVEAMEVEAGVVSVNVLSSEDGAVCATAFGLLEYRSAESFFCRLPFDTGGVLDEFTETRPVAAPSSCMSMSRLSSSRSWPPMSDAGRLTAGEDDRKVRVLKSSLSGEEDLLPV